jgi:hypothetical protein
MSTHQVSASNSLLYEKLAERYGSGLVAGINVEMRSAGNIKDSGRPLFWTNRKSDDYIVNESAFGQRLAARYSLTWVFIRCLKSISSGQGAGGKKQRKSGSETCGAGNLTTFRSGWPAMTRKAMRKVSRGRTCLQRLQKNLRVDPDSFARERESKCGLILRPELK